MRTEEISDLRFQIADSPLFFVFLFFVLCVLIRVSSCDFVDRSSEVG